MNNKLKPCPFCGEETNFYYIAHYNYNGHQVACNECGATGTKADSQDYARRLWNDGDPRDNANQDAEINRLTALVASQRVEIAKGEEGLKLLAEVHDNIVVMQCYYFLATRIKNLLTRIGYVPPQGDEG